VKDILELLAAGAGHDEICRIIPCLKRKIFSPRWSSPPVEVTIPFYASLDAVRYRRTTAASACASDLRNGPHDVEHGGLRDAGGQ
jgi:hypothetical protein